MARTFILLLVLLGTGSVNAQYSGHSALSVVENSEVDLLHPLPPGWLDWEESGADDSESQSPALQRFLATEGVANDSVELKGIGLEHRSMVRNADGAGIHISQDSVQPIPSFANEGHAAHRYVRYDVPLDDVQSHHTLNSRGFEGELIDVPVAVDVYERSGLGRFKVRFKSLFGLLPSNDYPKKNRVIRYEVPADDIALHTTLADLDGEIVEPGILRLPEVRFFQPKARVFMDLKRKNDDEFDLFSNGAILASLDVVELYFPLPLISERFARIVGKPSRLSQLGWRVGGTIGVGITTALNNGDADNGSAPISTLSSGIRYEFPLGRPSRELIESGDPRFDQRTRVGIETGLQGGISTNESLGDSTDVGFYIGIQVNTPWSNYGS